MISPDKALLSRIQEQCTYRDEKSEEKLHDRINIKPKFKLAGRTISDLEQFIFFVTTTTESACEKILTIIVRPSDWVNIEPKNLPKHSKFRECTSYININKWELLTAEEILRKIKDRGNGFLYVAKLSNDKFEELCSLRERIPLSRHPMQPDIKELITQALAPKVKEIMEELGLR